MRVTLIWGFVYIYIFSIYIYVFSIVDLQGSVNFCCTAKCPSHLYIRMYIYHFSRITLHHVPSRVTGYSSRCYTAGSHCLSTPNAKSFAPTNPGLPAHPLPPLPPWQPQIEFYLLKSLIILYSSVLPLSSPGNANCSVCLLRYRLCLTSVSSTPSFCPSPGHGTCNHLPVSPLTLTLPSGKSHQIVQIGPRIVSPPS